MLQFSNSVEKFTVQAEREAYENRDAIKRESYRRQQREAFMSTLDRLVRHFDPHEYVSDGLPPNHLDLSRLNEEDSRLVLHELQLLRFTVKEAGTRHYKLSVGDPGLEAYRSSHLPGVLASKLIEARTRFRQNRLNELSPLIERGITYLKERDSNFAYRNAENEFTFLCLKYDHKLTKLIGTSLEQFGLSIASQHVSKLESVEAPPLLKTVMTMTRSEPLNRSG